MTKHGAVRLCNEEHKYVKKQNFDKNKKGNNDSDIACGLLAVGLCRYAFGRG